MEELIPLSLNFKEEGESNGRVSTTTDAPNQTGRDNNWLVFATRWIKSDEKGMNSTENHMTNLTLTTKRVKVLIYKLI